MHEQIHARVGPKHLEKLERLQNATGLNTSSILRFLIEQVEFEPAKIQLNLSHKTESNGKFVAEPVAFSA